MTPPPLKKTWFVINTPEAARALADPQCRRYFLPFILKDLSLSEAAHNLEVRPNTLLYQIKKFLALGLLEVAEVRRRRGRASKRYRATAERFFVPFALTSAETIDVLRTYPRNIAS